MVDFKKIEEKWQQKWEADKVFEPEVDAKKPKFFLNFPYPYINAYQHIGHLFTLMKVEAFARYKRLKGFNVLFPQGWHVTGSPIVNAANRVRDREEKQMKIMGDMNIPDELIPKFEKPEFWLEFFAPEFKKDYKSVGMSIDWRREFFTTSLNPHYDKFIQWQFKKLKEKGYVIKGKFPVVWCPKCETAVGDHGRKEGEGETSQEFVLTKFKLEDERFLITATLRPDTILGITNVYINPTEEYVEISVGRESWIVGKPFVEQFRMQNGGAKVIRNVRGIDFVGKKVNSFGDKKIPVLPATFLDSNYGTGLVHSVPSDSADDLIALQDLQKDEALLEKYGLDKDEIRNIKPIPVFNTPEIGENSAQFFLDKYGVKSQRDGDKLNKIKKELYKLTFTKSTFNEKYAKGFSKDLTGMLVSEGQELIKRELLERDAIALFYQLTGKVVCRCLTECAVKIVDDQWFIDYNNPEWKQKTHKCLDQIKLYPEKVRSQFNYVVDWLHEWACVRENGLGTRLPWDERWLIESLSDSTVYMAYYTIAHLIKEVPVEFLDDSFFDAVFLGKGKPSGVDSKLVEKMKNEFDYWYPVDFRNSGKDLVQNHLTFFIFNHVAIFDEDKWPKGIGVNGWVTVDGQKMSKSLGNMVPVREVVKEFGADAARITILNGGEGMDDPNWDSSFAKGINSKLSGINELITAHYNRGRVEMNNYDVWFESKLNSLIKEISRFMDESMFRSAIQKIYFELQKLIRSYLLKGHPNKHLISKAIEVQLIMLSPFTPHLCEEYWSRLGKGLVSFAEWPECDESKISKEAEFSEELVSTIISDVNHIKELAKLEKVNKIKIIISPKWKYDFFVKFKSKVEETRDVGSIIRECKISGYEKEIAKMVPGFLKNPVRVPKVVLSQEKDLEIINQNLDSIKKQFNAEIVIELAEESNEVKKGNAVPGKPAIMME